MYIDVVTIFPELFEPFVRTSLLDRATQQGLLTLEIHDLRSFTQDRHRVVDDEPYGGGGGMVMKAAPWLEAVRRISNAKSPWRVLLSPQGSRLDERKVRELGERPRLLLLCARYEGVDQRVVDLVVDEEISIGDYVMSGGEVPAMVVIEAVSRQIPGVVGRARSVEQDSFRNGLLDFPHYTRPREIEGRRVPEVLLSGDHAAIQLWRRREGLRATLEKRPDLLSGRPIDLQEEKLLKDLRENAQRVSGQSRGEGNDLEDAKIPVPTPTEARD